MNVSLISHSGRGYMGGGGEAPHCPSLHSTAILVHARQTWAEFCNYNHIIVLGTQEPKARLVYA
jgi:hypothetical protein